MGRTRSEVRAGPGAWALPCGKGKPLGLQRGHRGGRGAAGPRTRRPSATSNAKAQREGTPGEGALSYPHATGRQEGPANPSCDDQGHEHAGQEGRPLSERGWGTHGPWAPHRPPPPPPPPPPPWPPASGAPDIMRNRTTGMMYIHCEPDRMAEGQTDKQGDREKRGENEQCPGQGGEGGGRREGRR